MINRIVYIFSAVLLILTSCTKKGDVGVQANYTGPIMVNFSNYEIAEGDLSYVRSELIFKDSLQDVNVELKLTNTTETAPSDILVYLTKVDAIVSNYNTANGGGLTTVTNNDPALVYDFSKPVVIKKGTRRALINVKVNPVKLTQANAIGLGILRVEGAGAIINNTNLSKVVIEFSARNIYDGIYSIVSGKVVRYTGPNTPANDALSGSIAGNPDLVLTTVGPNTVEITNLRWANAQGVAGIDNLRATVDPATNLVTLQALGNATLVNWTGSTTGITYNRYNPATKTMSLAFKWTSTAPAYREYELVIRYKGPR